MSPEPPAPEPSLLEETVPAPRSDPRAWGAAVALAALLLAVDGAMVWAFRVRPWTLVVPGAVLAIALRGRSASLASWRDALGLLCLATVPLVALLSPDTPRPLRFALNSLGTAGAVLLALGLILDEGIGAGVRRRSWPMVREGLHGIKVRLVQVGRLSGILPPMAQVWGTLGVPLVAVTALAILATGTPSVRGRGPWFRGGPSVVAALGLLGVLAGAAIGAWSPIGAVFLAAALPMLSDTSGLTEPVPARRSSGGPSARNPKGAISA